MSNNIKEAVELMTHRLEKTYWLIAILEIVSGVGLYFLFQNTDSVNVSTLVREGVKGMAMALILFTVPISFQIYKNGIHKALKQENFQEKIEGYAKVWMRRWWVWGGCYVLTLLGYTFSGDVSMLYLMGILVILTLVMRPASHLVKEDLKIY